MIFLQYGTNHFLAEEWLYNDADVDHSPVVWARDMGPKDNEELRRYYRHRTAWVLAADSLPPKLLPYETVYPH